MSNALRLSEKWFKRGLWLVAVVFAGFLVGLGGTIVGDLPKVEETKKLADFMDAAESERLKAAIRDAKRARQEADEALAQAQLRLDIAQGDSRAATDSFNAWLATRRATERSDQDPELISRTTDLERLRRLQREALSAVEAQQKAQLDARQAADRAQRRLAEMEQEAGEQLRSARRAQELRVFLYRLALTLPLLAVAGWLFARKRHGTWWPFVWGFILFAVFTFFVELVPYLPSYGGYVRYTVGIVITVLVGRQAILAMNNYLARQKAAEAQPDAKRRRELAYDTALARLAKGVCPGCERIVDLKNERIDFCPHCGIGLFDRCGGCRERKSAFSPFCHACGAPAREPAASA
jgi:predicted RNA-binding Zn-ribbon protein involved in translation (DUF1610 family)